MQSPLGGARAPLARRCAACLIDLAIAGVLGGIAATLAELALASAGSGDALIEPMRQLLLVAVYAGYCVLLMAGPGRATLGQRCFSLEVRGPAGGRVSFSDALARWAGFLAAALPLGAGLLLALGPDGRPFQDRICDSRVVIRPVRAAGRAA